MEFKLPSTPWQQDTIYHERQSRQFCGLHCINNMFQRKVYTKQEMDSIADEMYQKELALYQDETKPNSKILLSNSHRSSYFILGSFGNYSFEVMSEALHRKGYEMTKLRIEEQAHQFENLNLEVEMKQIVGFIVCGPSLLNKKKGFNLFQGFFSSSTAPKPLPKFSAGGHWFSISKHCSDSNTVSWVHHDSHFKKPTCFDSTSHLLHYLLVCAIHFNAQIWKISSNTL